jgi:AcrR family transcriptional regulator
LRRAIGVRLMVTDCAATGQCGLPPFGGSSGQRNTVPYHRSITLFHCHWAECYDRAVPRVKQRTDALRERGVASALAVLAEEGVAGLTTRTVARRAEASVPAIYEVFGDKAGLIREVFFEGFRMLGDDLSALPATADPLEAVRRLVGAFRRFVLANPVLAQVMFSRPFADFDPTANDLKAGLSVSKIFVRYAAVAVDAGLFAGNPTDIAHVIFAFAEGLAAAEGAQRLGGSKQAVDRRWRLGLNTLIDGLTQRPDARVTTRRRAGTGPVRRET